MGPAATLARRLRVLLLSAPLVACAVAPAPPPVDTSGSTNAVGSAGASGSPWGTGDDDAGCAPATPTFTPVYHPPALFAPSCTGPLIQAYYDDCFGSNLNLAACAAWTAANPECNNCIAGASSPDGDDWGPILVYPDMTALNQGGCVAARLHYPLCAEAIEEEQECEHAACDGSCSGALSGEEICLAQARTGACTTWEQNVADQCSGVSSPCLGSSDVEASFLSIAAAFCE